jgi:hypothetical protein
VLAVLTHQSMPKLHRAKRNLLMPPPPAPLQSGKIDHYGQYVALVVAETPQQASMAARLVEVNYERAQALLSANDPGAKAKSSPYGLDMKRGDVEAAMASAEVTVGGTFTTSAQAHNPMGLFATVAWWEEGKLTVHDSTQYPFLVRFTAPAGEVERLFYGFSVFHCLPVGMVGRGAVGTGTVIRAETVGRYAEEADFSTCEVMPIQNDFWRFYLLKP